MKYIDVKKLVAEIERLKATNPSEYNYQNAEGYIWALEDMEKAIDSLMQEQQIGEEYTIEIGKHTHTLRVGSKSDIDNLIRQEKQEQPELPPIGYAETYYQKGLHDGIIKGRMEILEKVEEIEKRKSEPILMIKEQEQSDKESLNESQQEFVNIVTERMLKEGPIPTLNGKQKAEFEKEFNRFKQITGMINFPAHMEVYKRIILWFMAWGADNLPNLNKVTDHDELDFQQEMPEINFENEFKNERTKLLDAFGPMNGEQSLAVKNFARHFVEFGLNARKV